MRTTFEALCYLLNNSNNELPIVKNYIAGSFLNAAGGELLDSEEPATGKVWLKIVKSGSADVDLAASSAHNAFASWSQTSKEHRAQLLNKVADIVEKYADDFARLESRDQGKTVQMAKQIEIPRCIKNFRAFAAAILCHTNPSSFQEVPIRAVNYVKLDPIGVAALICPWNLPLYLLSFKLAPALACGNTVICKPSEMTSATAFALMHAFVEAGVVNMVLGTGQSVGEPMCLHHYTNVISFTGSTLVGRRIAAIAAPAHKKLSLELGGKNAAVVFGDVDLEEILPGLIRSCFANQGEICLCTSRLYVHSSIYDKFLERFVVGSSKLVVGDPNDSETSLGALISRAHFEKVTSYIQYAHDQNYTIHCGEAVQLSGRLERGYFVPPTIISGVPNDSRLIKEEIFGPVVVVSKFETADEAVELVNSVDYGLSASVWSKQIDNINTVANRLRVGTVWCNCWLVRDLNMPFGGTKHSGTGREGIQDSLHFFTEQKTICIKLPN